MLRSSFLGCHYIVMQVSGLLSVRISKHMLHLRHLRIHSPYLTLNSMQLSVAQLVRKFSAFYGTGRFWFGNSPCLDPPSAIPQLPSIFEIILVLTSHLRIGLARGILQGVSCKGCLARGIFSSAFLTPHLFHACCMFFLFNPLSLDW